MENELSSLRPKKAPPIIPVVVAGGVGSRLWPLSREDHPKAFIKLDREQSLIQKTYARAVALEGVRDVVTVTNRDLFFYTKDEYEQLQYDSISHHFILEPVRRNSAAAIALAAQYVKQHHGEDALILALPADHLIGDEDAFGAVVAAAAKRAKDGSIVTFGITPDAPKTGYGYIEVQHDKVVRFVEKPDLATAKAYLKSGNFYWNSGMLCMQAKSILEEIDLHMPKLHQQSSVMLSQSREARGANWVQKEIHQKDFELVEDISIDYAVLEQSSRVACIPCSFSWSDVGSWADFGELYPKDAQGNCVTGETVLENVENCTIHAGHRLVAGLGLRDLVVVDTHDALLIAQSDDAQDVRKIVKKLKANNHPICKYFPTVHRPWGSYTVLQESRGFKLKRIEVKPHAKLSLQSHRHRSEHWVIVKGTARVTNGEQELRLSQGESTYIPVGHKHRLENTQDQGLVLIEVQCGEYLGEDDIVRYEDAYGRNVLKQDTE